MTSSVPYLSPAHLQAALGTRDLSDPREGGHAIQILTERAVEALSCAWSCEVRWCRGPKAVLVADNYDRLGYGADAITREARYTCYLSAGKMLRSHSSAMIPPALRQLTRVPGEDVLLVCPGMVYRRDAIDWQHSGTPHQLDLWRITRRAMTGADLDEMISCLLGVLVPDLPYRREPRTHPYTRRGRQVDVRQGGRWVEIWECGLAHPRVLSATACDQLPASAARRLGARPGQKNLLVRVVLRDLEKTLTKRAANLLRDRIYLAIDQGVEYQLARQGAPPDAA